MIANARPDSNWTRRLKARKLAKNAHGAVSRIVHFWTVAPSAVLGSIPIRQGAHRVRPALQVTFQTPQAERLAKDANLDALWVNLVQPNALDVQGERLQI